MNMLGNVILLCVVALATRGDALTCYKSEGSESGQQQQLPQECRVSSSRGRSASSDGLCYTFTTLGTEGSRTSRGCSAESKDVTCEKLKAALLGSGTRAAFTTCTACHLDLCNQEEEGTGSVNPAFGGTGESGEGVANKARQGKEQQKSRIQQTDRNGVTELRNGGRPTNNRAGSAEEFGNNNNNNNNNQGIFEFGRATTASPRSTVLSRRRPSVPLLESTTLDPDAIRDIGESKVGVVYITTPRSIGGQQAPKTGVDYVTPRSNGNNGQFTLGDRNSQGGQNQGQGQGGQGQGQGGQGQGQGGFGQSQGQGRQGQGQGGQGQGGHGHGGQGEFQGGNGGLGQFPNRETSEEPDYSQGTQGSEEPKVEVVYVTTPRSSTTATHGHHKGGHVTPRPAKGGHSSGGGSSPLMGTRDGQTPPRKAAAPCVHAAVTWLALAALTLAVL